jgi:hypothetical protein
VWQQREESTLAEELYKFCGVIRPFEDALFAAENSEEREKKKKQN